MRFEGPDEPPVVVTRGLMLKCYRDALYSIRAAMGCDGPELLPELEPR